MCIRVKARVQEGMDVGQGNGKVQGKGMVVFESTVAVLFFSSVFRTGAHIILLLLYPWYKLFPLNKDHTCFLHEVIHDPNSKYCIPNMPRTLQG